MRQFIKLIEVNALLTKKMGVNMKRIKALLGQTYFTNDDGIGIGIG